MIALHVMQIERLKVLETIVQERGMITTSSSSCCQLRSVWNTRAYKPKRSWPLGTQKNKTKQKALTKAAAGADTQTVAAAEAAAAARGGTNDWKKQRQREEKKGGKCREGKNPLGTVEEAMIKTRAIRVMRSVVFTRLTVHAFTGPAI
jgi:hypothetical protein